MSNKTQRPEKPLNVGTLNAQGCNDALKQDQILQDALRYDMHILGLTETHIKEETHTAITVKYGDKIRTYNVYFGGIEQNNPYSGTGLIIDSTLNPKFTNISDRITTENYYQLHKL